MLVQRRAESAVSIQMAKQRGVTVIGTVSTTEEAQVAREAGADHLILSSSTDFESETMRPTDGQGVHAVYDSVGRTTFEKSFNVLRARGFMVVYGLSSSLIPAFDVNRLSGITGSSNKGSLFLTFATLNDYAARREDLLRRGYTRVRLASTFPLAETARAHRLLESCEVVGKLVLLP
jgi:NADPH2:quinone reductase